MVSASPELLTATDPTGNTCLYVACLLGLYTVTQVLTEAGARGEPRSQYSLRLSCP